MSWMSDQAVVCSRARLYTSMVCFGATTANRTAGVYSRYGSSTHTQLYIYGVLDTRPTELVRNFGFAWSMGGWLLFPFLQKIGPAAVQALKQRVAAELLLPFSCRIRLP